MTIKKYKSFVIFSIIINLVSVFTALFAIWSVILYIFLIFIVNNRDANKVLKDKQILGFIQAFMLCCFTFIFTIFGLSLIPIMDYVVKTYLANFYYLFLLLGIAGLISFYYLFIKLLIEAINVVRKKEVSQ